MSLPRVHARGFDSEPSGIHSLEPLPCARRCESRARPRNLYRKRHGVRRPVAKSRLSVGSPSWGSFLLQLWAPISESSARFPPDATTSGLTAPATPGPLLVNGDGQPLAEAASWVPREYILGSSRRATEPTVRLSAEVAGSISLCWGCFRDPAMLLSPNPPKDGLGDSP